LAPPDPSSRVRHPLEEIGDLPDVEWAMRSASCAVVERPVSGGIVVRESLGLRRALWSFLGVSTAAFIAWTLWIAASSGTVEAWLVAVLTWVTIPPAVWAFLGCRMDLVVDETNGIAHRRCLPISAWEYQHFPRAQCTGVGCEPAVIYERGSRYSHRRERPVWAVMLHRGAKRPTLLCWHEEHARAEAAAAAIRNALGMRDAGG
jgi:hypothetical protein